MGTGDNARDVRERRLIKSAEGYRERLGECVMLLDEYVQGARGQGEYLTEIRFMVRYGDEGDILVVIKRESEGEKEIAFHSADTMAEAMSGALSRIGNGSLKWREDKPYEAGSNNGR